MRLDHTLLAAKDKEESARFFARIMGAEYTGVFGEQALVWVDRDLTLRFDERQTGRLHLAFHVSEDEFDQIMTRIKADGVVFGANGGPVESYDQQVGTLAGGRRVYFNDPGGHSLEILTSSTDGGVG